LHHKNAGGLPSPIAYESNLNGAATWDANRIFGCHGDDGVEGFNCSLWTCPLVPIVALIQAGAFVIMKRVNANVLQAGAAVMAAATWDKIITITAAD
jgi:hypothetical protein